MGQLKYTTADANKILDGRLHSPIQDIVGDDYTSGAPLAMSAGVQYPFLCNGNTRNFSIFPDHITNIWDSSANVATFADFMNTPEIVANVQSLFMPTVASAGQVTIRCFVNETVPIEFKSSITPFKATLTTVRGLITLYAGDDVGFDIKNKGVFFTMETSASGNMYNPAIELYRT